MLPALLTTFFFAASGMCGQRTAVWFGPLRGNALRLALAAVALGLLSWFICPVSLSTRTAHRLFYSGLLGFGAGDVALFLAYPRLGSRLTLLINLCSAPFFGAAGDAMLTALHVSTAQWASCVVIISGVVLALSGGVRLPHHDGKNIFPGVCAALVAGLGQGGGASLSRWAKEAAAAEGLHFTGINEAFVRVLPGLAFAATLWVVSIVWMNGKTKPARGSGIAFVGSPHPQRGWPWLLGAALTGPVLGVSCFQWALGTVPSAIVLSVTAATPVLVMPLAFYSEGDRPGAAAIIGGVIAVTGMVFMSLFAVV